MVFATSPLNPDVTYATGIPGLEDRGSGSLFLTRNGGASWTNVTEHIPIYQIVDVAIAPYDPRIVYVVTTATEGRPVFKTTDGGTTWVNVSGDLPDVPTWAVAAHPTLPEVVLVINDIGTFVSPNGGATWRRSTPGMLQGDAVALPSAPLPLALRPMAPNPARDAAAVTFQLPEAAAVRLALYDVLGREVAVLVDGEREAGAHSVTLRTARLAAGTYILRLATGEDRLTQRVTVVR